MTTDKKTLAVDVLAVLRQIADGEGDAQVLAMRARAAVAELIEAVEEVAKAERFDSDVESWVQYSLRFRASKHRLSSALARVKGESA